MKHGISAVRCQLCFTTALLNRSVDHVTAGLLQTHASLKEHAQLLEATLADRASMDVRMDSAMRDDIEKRDRAIREATDQIQHLENDLTKERQTLKDVKTQVIIIHDYSLRAYERRLLRLITLLN